jgi:hypothetical protein
LNKLFKDAGIKGMHGGSSYNAVELKMVEQASSLFIGAQAGSLCQYVLPILYV